MKCLQLVDHDRNQLHHILVALLFRTFLVPPSYCGEKGHKWKSNPSHLWRDHKIWRGSMSLIQNSKILLWRIGSYLNESHLRTMRTNAWVPVNDRMFIFLVYPRKFRSILPSNNLQAIISIQLWSTLLVLALRYSLGHWFPLDSLHPATTRTSQVRRCSNVWG